MSQITCIERTDGHGHATLDFYFEGAVVHSCEPAGFGALMSGSRNLTRFHVVTSCQSPITRQKCISFAVCDSHGTVLVYVFNVASNPAKLLNRGCFEGVVGIIGMSMTDSAIAFWNEESVWVKRSMYDTQLPVGSQATGTFGHVMSDCGYLAYIQSNGRVGIISDRLTTLNVECKTLHWIGADLLVFSESKLTMINGDSIASNNLTARQLQFSMPMARVLNITDDMIIVESKAKKTEAAKFSVFF